MFSANTLHLEEAERSPPSQPSLRLFAKIVQQRPFPTVSSPRRRAHAEAPQVAAGPTPRFRSPPSQRRDRDSHFTEPELPIKPIRVTVIVFGVLFTAAVVATMR